MRYKKFRFGRNWRRFISSLTHERITISERSLQYMLQLSSLTGKTFLDVGSGSGLFSLAAYRLGARVHSFDSDPECIACARYLRSKYTQHDDTDDGNLSTGRWSVQQGSVLDREYIDSLGTYDIVYAWGVLHHTGDLWGTLENVVNLVKIDGSLFLAVYNDQGFKSKIWLNIKRFYNSGLFGKCLVIASLIPVGIIKKSITSMIKRKNLFREYKYDHRGMSVVVDWLDWLGGYPYEVASIERITDFFNRRGFRLDKLVSAKGALSNNQYVFTRIENVPDTER